MDRPIDTFWEKRLDELAEALEKNNFRAFVAADAEAARRLVLEEIIPGLDPKPASVSWGGSVTFVKSGLYDALRDSPDLEVLDTFDKSVTPEQSYERRRRALLSDLFFTSTNAVTEDGTLVNLDMIGNRVGALTFGPRHVIVLAGRNKIVQDFDEAYLRIKNYVAPVNAMRLDKKTPCLVTSRCQDCSSPDRICNTWTITEKSFPKGRVTVVLINQDLGF